MFRIFKKKMKNTVKLNVTSKISFLGCDTFEYLTCSLSFKFISELAFFSDPNYVFIFFGQIVEKMMTAM